MIVNAGWWLSEMTLRLVLRVSVRETLMAEDEWVASESSRCQREYRPGNSLNCVMFITLWAVLSLIERYRSLRA